MELCLTDAISPFTFTSEVENPLNSNTAYSTSSTDTVSWDELARRCAMTSILTVTVECEKVQVVAVDASVPLVDTSVRCMAPSPWFKAKKFHPSCPEAAV
jgi:hypothetical protein